MIYLDYAAHTSTCKEVFNLMMKVNEDYPCTANSDNNIGEASKAKYEKEKSKILDLLNVPNYDLVPTSSATEANNLALKGVAEIYASVGRHIISSPIEHSSINGSLQTLKEKGFEVDYLDIDKDGRIVPESLANLLRKDTILVSLASVNSEVGVIQDIEKLANIVRSKSSAILHIDATQALGKIKLDYSLCDLFTFTSHKLFGLTGGAGALVKSKKVLLKPQIDGGKSFTPFRSSTPDLAALVGLRFCVESHMLNIDENYEKVKYMNDDLVEFFGSFKDIMINSSSNPYILNISTQVYGETLREALSKEEVYISTKSACVAKTTLPKTVYEMFRDKKRAKNSIRISLSHKTRIEEIENFKKIFTKVYKDIING